LGMLWFPGLAVSVNPKDASGQSFPDSQSC
jgi:hypothetical protein